MKKIEFCICVVFFFFLFSTSSHAYLDPGTFSIVMQSILAVIAGVVATYKIWLYKLKSFLKRFQKNTKP